jgi:hypothetical protein
MRTTLAVLRDGLTVFYCLEECYMHFYIEVYPLNRAEKATTIAHQRTI